MNSKDFNSSSGSRDSKEKVIPRGNTKPTSVNNVAGNVTSGNNSKRNIPGGKNIQVIYNGRIATPQSLIPRKDPVTIATNNITTSITSIAGSNKTVSINPNTGNISKLRIAKIDENSASEYDIAAKMSSQDTKRPTTPSKVKRSNQYEAESDEPLLYINGQSFHTEDFEETLVALDDVEEFATIILSETQTITVLDIPSFLFTKDEVEEIFVPAPKPEVAITAASTSLDTIPSEHHIDESGTETDPALASNTSAIDLVAVDIPAPVDLVDDNAWKKLRVAITRNIETRNQDYAKMQERHISAPDSFIIHTTQTLNDAQKNQNEMTVAVTATDKGCQASSYAISDETRMDNEIADDESEIFSSRAGPTTGTVSSGTGPGLTGNERTITVRIVDGTEGNEQQSKKGGNSKEIASVRKFVNDSVNVSLLSPGCLMDMHFQIKPVAAVRAIKESKSSKRPGASTVGMSGVNIGVSGADIISNQNNHMVSSSRTGNAMPSTLGKSRLTSSGASRVGNTNKSNAGGLSSASNMITEVLVGPGPGFEYSFGPNPSVPEYPASIDGDELLKQERSKKILKSSALLLQLQMIERAVLQNIYYSKQLKSRDVMEPVKNDDSDGDDDDDDDESYTMSGSLKSAPATPTSLTGSFTPGRSKKGTQFEMPPSPGPGPGNYGGMSRSPSMRGMAMSRSNSQKSFSGLARQNPEFVTRLFRFANVDIVTLQREVTCITYHPVDSNLLVVGYSPSMLLLNAAVTKPPSTTINLKASTTLKSSLSTANATNATNASGSNPNNGGIATEENKRNGIILFWSSRNPEYPEKILYTPHGVTALAFSKVNPLILAVGMINGDIAIYDMRRENDEWKQPMETSESVTGTGGHTEAVGQIKWVSRGGVSATAHTAPDTLEDIVTVSTDGTVLQWSLRKGFSVSTLMKLKRGVSGEGWLSRLSAGLCFDFPSDDTSTYLVGTEEGALHRCSVSYNEQSLETFSGHTGPIYNVKYSPFSPNTFITCSADWSICLYRVTSNEPIAKLQTTGLNTAITDIAWCPGNSSVFASISSDGKLLVWDLYESRTEPFIIFDTLKDDPDYQLDVKYFESDPTTSLNRLLRQTLSMSNLMSSTKLNNTNKTDNLNATNGSTTNNVTASAKTYLNANSVVNRLVENLISNKTDIMKKSLTCVTFSPNSHTIAVGDSLGGVIVYKLSDEVEMTDMITLYQESLKTAGSTTDDVTATTSGVNIAAISVKSHAATAVDKSAKHDDHDTVKNNRSKLSIMTAHSASSAHMTKHSTPTHALSKPVTYEQVVNDQIQKLSQAIEQLTQPSNVGKKSVSRSQTATPTHRTGGL